MTELSHEARELIAKARPAERADASAKKRVWAALASHLAPPPAAPPSAGPAAAGAAGVASASKLVLICSLTVAAVVGTAAIVKTRHGAQRGPAEQRTVAVTLPPRAPLAAPALRDSDARTAALPATGPHEVERLAMGADHRALGSRATIPNGEIARKAGLRVKSPRGAEPTERPTALAAPERPNEPTSVPASSVTNEPRPSPASFPSSWRASDLPAPIPDRQVTGITPNAGQSKRCSAARELKLLSAAQAALRDADGQRAIDLLDQHAKSCPSATFWEERSAARVLALCLLHRKAQALGEAEQLVSRAPRSPLLARLRSSCAAAAVVSSTRQDGQQ